MRKNKKNRRSFLTLLLCCLFFTLTVAFFSPMEVVLINEGEFYFPFGNVWWFQLLVALGAGIALSLVLFILPGRIGQIAAAIPLGLGLAAYIQAMFLNGAMVSLTGDRMTLTDQDKTVNLVIWGGTYRLFGGRLMKAMIAAAEMKTSLPPCEIFVRAVGCNILVCIAVWCALKAKGTAGKIIATFLPVFAFVYCGFEHSIANMYFIPGGMAVQIISGGGLTISCSGLFLNLLWVTLGNIVGGAVVVAGGLWLIESEKPVAEPGDNQSKAG